jgi:hypothetical protein
MRFTVPAAREEFDSFYDHVFYDRPAFGHMHKPRLGLS